MPPSEQQAAVDHAELANAYEKLRAALESELQAACEAQGALHFCQTAAHQLDVAMGDALGKHPELADVVWVCSVCRQRPGEYACCIGKVPCTPATCRGAHIHKLDEVALHGSRTTEGKPHEHSHLIGNATCDGPGHERRDSHHDWHHVGSSSSA